MSKKRKIKKPAKKGTISQKVIKKAVAKAKKDRKDKADVGRPPFKVTPKIIKKAETLASQGLTNKQISACLGCAQSTFQLKLVELPELSEALRRGKAEGINEVTNAVFNKAKDGDIHACKYYLNNRDNENWNERRIVDVGGMIGIKEVTDMSEEEILRELAEIRRKKANAEKEELEE